MKTTKIYWAYCNSKYQYRAEEPVPVWQNYFKNKDIKEQGLEYVKCPAFKDFYNNTFGLTSLFDYDITFKDGEVKTQMHDQKFFQDMILVRNHASRLASFRSWYIFIAVDESLEMEFLPSNMENNAFNKSSIIIPAVLDVGKYVRIQECAFHCREDKMEIKENEIYSYVKFKTNNQIKLQRFLWTDAIENVIEDSMIGLKHYRRRTFKPLEWYYKKQQAFKTKQRVIKLLKENLL
tara:strand:- start:67 stop:771 length:705 start_codon:yes stop_codon:yes gene_type:complete